MHSPRWLTGAAGPPGPFASSPVPAIVFGSGSAEGVAGFIDSEARRVLLVTGSDPARSGHLIERIAGSGRQVRLSSQPGEPTLTDVIRTAELAQEHGAEWVVAHGGGSVIDTAKAAAALAPNEASGIEDCLEGVGTGRRLERPPLPVIAIPTTAGTGSEVTKNAVIALPDKGLKVSLRDERMVPRVAVIDPTMTIGLPRSITASSGLDAIVQLVEAFTTPMATPYSDLFALAGAQRAFAAFPIVLDHPADIAARASMSLAATLSGLALTNAKLGAVHGLASALGGLLPVPHGMVCGIMAAPIFSLTVNRLRQSDPDGYPMRRYQQLAAMATGEPTARAEGFAIWIAAMVRSAGLPRLRDLGVTTDLIPRIAESAARSNSTKGHPTVLTARDFHGLLVLAR